MVVSTKTNNRLMRLHWPLVSPVLLVLLLPLVLRGEELEISMWGCHAFTTRPRNAGRIVLVAAGHLRNFSKVPPVTPSSVRHASSTSMDDFMDNLDRLLSELPASSVTDSAGEGIPPSSSRHHSGTSRNTRKPQQQQQQPLQNSEWRTIDWNARSKENDKLVVEPIGCSVEESLSKVVLYSRRSPVEQRTIQGRTVYFKRDDLLRLSGSQISGNKARKMLSLNGIPVDHFPRCLVSYGGPQSNAMLALAAICNFKNRQALGITTATTTMDKDDSEIDYTEESSLLLSEAEDNYDDDDIDDDDSLPNHPSPRPVVQKRFIYYTKKLPRFLRNQPSGNLYRAKTLGMELVELNPQDYNDWFGGDSGGSPEPPMGLKAPVAGDSVWVGFDVVASCRFHLVVSLFVLGVFVH
jgi:hypothetical protein